MNSKIVEHDLYDIYGKEIAAQTLRYGAAAEAFNAAYGKGEIHFFRAPGRVNLIGEHTDYNHGFVMPVALDRDVVLLARPRKDNRVRVSNVERKYRALSFAIGPELAPGARGDWGNYAKGAARELSLRLRRALRGFDGLVVGQPPFGVPRGVGLSSSSAMTVVVAVAIAQLNGWAPDGVTMAQLCAEAEWFVGTRGGIMDQFISLLGQRDHALFLDCRPDAAGKFHTEQVPLPGGYSVLIADSGVRHSNVRGAFNQRVAACRAGVQLLQARYPGITHLRDVQDLPWDELAPSLPEEATVGELEELGIGPGDVPGLTGDMVLEIRARCRHVWMENERVQRAVAALRTGDVTEFGRLLDEAHTSARDDYGVSCPELDMLVETAREVDGVVGARLTGAGWGGCVVAVVRDDAVHDFEAHVQDAYPVRSGRRTAVFACQSAPGAGVVGWR